LIIREKEIAEEEEGHDELLLLMELSKLLNVNRK
jgi:hypothetical protein